MLRRRPEFESGKTGAEAAKLKTRLAMQADLKFCGCPTPAEPIFESRAVYIQEISKLGRE